MQAACPNALSLKNIMSDILHPAPPDSSLDDRHFVRFYEHDVALLAEVADFLDRGLRGGGTAIVIATADHIHALRQQLAGLGTLKGEPGWYPGELITMEAESALAQFMVDGQPDAQRFDAVIGDVVRKACDSGKQVHAFGEMVALLCERGQYDAAIRLEQLWNALRDHCRFALFCAYPWRLFPTQEHASAFGRICHEHDHVCRSVPEGARDNADPGKRIAMLEQQVASLQGELAHARKSDQTLKHREREFADFIENAAEGLHRVGPDGIILWANKAELAMLGYRWEDYVGRHIAEFHVDRELIDHILVRLQTGETLNDQPAQLRCGNGSVKHVVISSNGCFENGQLRYTRCFTRDATERHLLDLAHQERKGLIAELAHANRAKDEFLAMLAHELRNPLAPISAAGQLLAVAAHDAAAVQHAAAVITRHVGHMGALIDDLLDAARVTRGLVVLAKTPLDLRDAVSEAVEQVQPRIQAKRHRFTLDAPAGPLLINGDRKRIVQIAANLISNASKFTPDGGAIHVQLRLAGDRAELIVTDNGVGMDEELAARAFGLFVQGGRTPDRAQGGLGIGLALAKNLVECHGGVISARSDGPGTGCTFTVGLPLLKRGQISPAPAAQPLPERAEQALRILVVDDNRDAADFLSTLLTAMGHSARAVYSSLAALEEAQADSPQVFFLDIGLPDIDGLALAQRLRAAPATAGAVLIAVTGYGQQQDRELTSAAGFYHHLVKPVSAAELSALLGKIAQRP